MQQYLNPPASYLRLTRWGSAVVGAVRWRKRYLGIPLCCKILNDEKNATLWVAIFHDAHGVHVSILPKQGPGNNVRTLVHCIHFAAAKKSHLIGELHIRLGQL